MQLSNTLLHLLGNRGPGDRLPWALARAMPALTRSLMSALSNCANEAITVKIMSPCGVVVSMFS